MLKIKLSAKIAVFFIVISIACIGFTTYLWTVTGNSFVAIVCACFSIFIILSLIFFVNMFKLHTSDVLQKLSDLISSITDIEIDERFDSYRDEMLSKIQAQVIKLSNILKAQNKKLSSEQDEIKSLISDISHQLKTPLANLDLYNELLNDSEISNDDRTQYSQDMKTQLEKLNFLIESLIKMSRLESGIIQLSPQIGDIDETIMKAVYQIYQKAQAKGIEVVFCGHDKVLLQHDINWTAEVIFNLLDNAVKYSNPNGKINITVNKYEVYVRIDIEDNGTGIRNDEINKIFRRFFRGSNAKEAEGVGIGLFLVREIITRQDGYIKVTSSFGKGSVFSVFMPI